MNLGIDQKNRRPLVDVSAAAAYMGVSPRFMRRLVAERRITFVKLGRHLRFELGDLDSFIIAGRVEAIAQFAHVASRTHRARSD